MAGRRKPHFSAKVIAFAVTERARGVRWQDIRNAIKQEFLIRSPTQRTMRSWYKEYDGGSIDLEKMIREAMIKVARDSIPVVALATLQLTLQQGMPALLKALRREKDPHVAVVVGLLETMEGMVGSEAYEKGVKKYREERREKK